jgi:hypothetical protein
VDVDDAGGAGRETCLDEGIIFRHVGLVDRSPEDIIREELPADGQPEDVVAVIVHEMRHLAFPIFACGTRDNKIRIPSRGRPQTEVLRERWVRCGRSTTAVRVTTEIEPLPSVSWTFRSRRHVLTRNIYASAPLNCQYIVKGGKAYTSWRVPDPDAGVFGAHVLDEPGAVDVGDATVVVAVPGIH